MRAMACLAVRKVPKRFTPTTRFHSAVSTMWTAPPPATPAAFTRPSTRPKARAASSTSATTDASSVTSTVVKAHAPGAGGHSLRGVRPGRGRRP